ncbi:MAG TPA: hypothetical protein VII49_02805 [Rhizomicrobium sp.]
MSVPTIVVAGTQWPVPLLAPRQNRIVVPLLIEGRTDYAALLEIVFAGLTRAHPQVSRGPFEEWPIPLYELQNALPVIARQTGLLKPGSAKTHATPSAPPDWDAIIARFCNFLPGTTPDYWEDALTWPRVEAMNEEWRQHPPVAVLVAGYLGYRPKPRRLEAVEELMRFFPNGQLRLN